MKKVIIRWLVVASAVFLMWFEVNIVPQYSSYERYFREIKAGEEENKNIEISFKTPTLSKVIAVAISAVLILYLLKDSQKNKQ